MHEHAAKVGYLGFQPPIDPKKEQSFPTKIQSYLRFEAGTGLGGGRGELRGEEPRWVDLP